MPLLTPRAWQKIADEMKRREKEAKKAGREARRKR